jgi:NADPH-dependent glutamate synthase beta subunit-like oxidoreductase
MHLTSVTDRILGEYDWTQCTAPCQRRCPAGIDIPEQIYQTKKGDYGRALAVIKERNPLPLICGRICPNPCELVCRRNMVDQAVAINPLKRFVADWERESGRRQQPYRAPATGRKAAVIGGGVEGLSASAFLARLGHEPVIFEARDQLGGLLRTAIPESRLPREVLDWEIEGILDLGVGAETNRALGRDLSLSQLFDQGFEAVLIATGGWDALLEQGEQALGPAPALPRLYLLLPLTMAWASGRDIDPGQDVAVIGGGKDGLAAARRALDKGARKATALLSADGLKGLEDAVAKSEAAGVEIITGVKVTGLTGVGDHLTGVEYKPKVGPPATLAADTLIAASGRMPEMIIVPEKQAEEEPAPSGENTPWRTRPPYRPMDSGDLFQPREPVSDYRAAVEAIGAGRRAAASIHRVFNGQPLPRLGLDIVHDPPLIDVDHLENPIPAPGRAQAPEVPDDQRSGPAQEIALGLSEEQARRESDRCLTCGLICYLRTQYH